MGVECIDRVPMAAVVNDRRILAPLGLSLAWHEVPHSSLFPNTRPGSFYICLVLETFEVKTLGLSALY